jgi:rhodanese-related sulfurtransferase
MQNVKCVLLEALLVATLGLAFALGANALSPRGLRLNRNYFPTAAAGRTSAPPPAKPAQIERGQTTNALAGADFTGALSAAVRRLQEHGLQPMGSNAIVQLFQDARYEQGLVVFVDARDDAHYQAGHIPGAWQFDHYRAENYLGKVLPVCLNAQQVVVYCTGGECEDSEFAAIMLRDAGVPRENLFVYAGGITEWTGNKLPIETGARLSGQLLDHKP